MLLHGFLDKSTVNGPGERAVIWYQGCNLGCSGCWNPETHRFNEDRRVSVYEFIDEKLADLPDTLSGITFSGGDPMQHYLDTLRISAWVKAYKPMWTIGMFTGYTEQELLTGKWEHYAGKGLGRDGMVNGDLMLWERLREHLDFAIMGRYNKLAPVNNPLITSSNQQLRLFSDAYTQTDFSPQAVEIFIDEDGLTQITGFPVGMDLDEFKQDAKRERQATG